MCSWWWCALWQTSAVACLHVSSKRVWVDINVLIFCYMYHFICMSATHWMLYLRFCNHMCMFCLVRNLLFFHQSILAVFMFFLLPSNAFADIVIRGILQVNIRILKKEIDSHEMHTKMKAERKVLVSKYSPFLRWKIEITSNSRQVINQMKKIINRWNHFIYCTYTIL